MAKSPSGRIAEPPILKPPVVMFHLAPPRPRRRRACRRRTVFLAGSIEAEPVGAISRLQKRGERRTAYQDAETPGFKWLSAALVLGRAVLVSIPICGLRCVLNPNPSRPEPVFHDLDIDLTNDPDDALSAARRAADVHRQPRRPRPDRRPPDNQRSR